MVDGDFFNTMAQVIPTVALAVFVAEAGGMTKKERRRRQELARERNFSAVGRFVSTLIGAVIISGVAYIEMICLVASANHKGTPAAAFASLLALGIMLALFIINALRDYLDQLHTAFRLPVLLIVALLCGVIAIAAGYEIGFKPESPGMVGLPSLFGWVKG